MKSHGIPILSCPATVVLIDDNKEFLHQYKLLIQRVAPCVAFSKPEEAIAYLEGKQQGSFLARCGEAFSADQSEISTQLALDEKQIHQEIYNPERFSDAILVIVDYDMPSMNGVEFCQKISNFNAQIMMLTGEADETIAINAFNDNIIDLYIQKSTPNLPAVILDRVKRLQTKHFAQLSTGVKRMLANKKYEPLSQCFVDDNFANFFDQLLDEHKICEYYYVSSPANIVLLDGDGNPSWLVIKDESEMSEMIGFALDQFLDEPIEALAPMFDKVKQRELMMLCYSDKDFQTPVEEWARLLHPCEKVQCGNNTYYCAYISGASGYSLDMNKIVSFNTYLDKHISM